MSVRLGVPNGRNKQKAYRGAYAGNHPDSRRAQLAAAGDDESVEMIVDEVADRWAAGKIKGRKKKDAR